jgi:hypothetical protein
MKKCRIRITRHEYDSLSAHLFPGDGDEHGAVVLAGLSTVGDGVRLLVREVHIARDGTDYLPGKIGYRALTPQFIHRMITRARDERLVYLAIHNHEADQHVDFSAIDLDSHKRGYPALLQIAKGMPVGALVFGRRSAQADIWMPGGKRLCLERLDVIGSCISRLRPKPVSQKWTDKAEFDRQVRGFGAAGQLELSQAKVAILGLGGVGSLLAEYLSRLGVGNFLLVDPETIEDTNLSRIVGSTAADVVTAALKVDIARRLIHAFNPGAYVETETCDAALASIANRLVECDYIFLAADSMRARLVVNAVVQQYLVPGVQLGSKVATDPSGHLTQVFSAIRPLRPVAGCLWCNQLIDPHLLALESKSDAERKAEAYGTNEPNPSVITLNAVSASHAVNDFLLDYLNLRPEPDSLWYDHFYHLTRKHDRVLPRADSDCPECSRVHGRFARGDATSLPTID